MEQESTPSPGFLGGNREGSEASEDFQIHTEEYTVYDDVATSEVSSTWNLDWNFDGLGGHQHLLFYAGIAGKGWPQAIEIQSRFQVRGHWL